MQLTQKYINETKRFSKMVKRGQLSVFIMIGIFLLLGIALFLVFFQGSLHEFFPNLGDPLVAYTETCMESIARQGLEVMTLQGGYITLPEKMSIFPDAYVDNGFKVPLWYYKGRDKKPTIRFMETELGKYIDENIGTCLNYDDFPQFEIEKLGNISTDVDIGYHDVEVTMHQKLKVKKYGADEYTYIDTFNTGFKSRFGEFYQLASELMDYENFFGFLENYTDEMIASSDYLPYEGMEISCKPSVWQLSKMKEYVQTLVMHNLNFLMFKNTKYYDTKIPYYDKQYKIDFTKNKFKDIGVKVIYNPLWDMDFEVSPSKNGIVKPIKFSIDRYLNTCVKIFHHKYSVNYPVLFQLSDEYGNRFYFASPVIMKRGLANRYNEILPWPTEYDDAGSIAYCANTSKISMFGLDDKGMLVSTPSIRNNRQNSLRVFAIDKVYGTVLPGVNISYACVNFKCSIGTTSYPMIDGLLTGAQPMLDKKFPDCSGGLVIAQHPNYQTKRVQMSVEENTNNALVTLEMYPLKQFNYKVMVVEDHNGIIDVRELTDDEKAVITIKNNDEMFEKTIVIPSDNDYFRNLSLMVGDLTYDLDIMLVNDDRYLGGLALNWTVNQDELLRNNYILFYALKKDPLYAPSTAKEWQEIYDFPINNSDKYPPELR